MHAETKNGAFAKLFFVLVTGVSLAVLYLELQRAFVAPGAAVLHPNRNQLLISADEAVLNIPIQEPVEFDGLSREQVLNMRRAALGPYLETVARGYRPADEVFVQIEDGRPWWGLNGGYFHGPGQRSIEGPSEESRFVLNPLLLVALAESRAYITKLEPRPGQRPFYPQPTALRYHPLKRTAVAAYRMGGYLQHFERIGSKPGQLHLIAYNARDFNFRFLAVDQKLSKNITAFNGGPVEIRQFIHRGGSCGYPGGCNNGSPDQKELELTLTALPAVVRCNLWQERPESAAAPADFNFTLEIDY